MTVSVDISEVLDVTKEAREQFRGIGPAMRRIGQDAAKHSRQNHLYQNRTGQAEKNTTSVTEATPNAVYTLVTINVPYGSYLMKSGRRDRHVSLTDLEESIETAEREMEYLTDGIEHALTK